MTSRSPGMVSRPACGALSSGRSEAPRKRGGQPSPRGRIVNRDLRRMRRRSLLLLHRRRLDFLDHQHLRLTALGPGAGGHFAAYGDALAVELFGAILDPGNVDVDAAGLGVAFEAPA